MCGFTKVAIFLGFQVQISSEAPKKLMETCPISLDLDSSLKLFKWASLQKQFRHTADTYHAIILKLGMAGKAGEVEGFCNEMVKEKCPGFEESLFALIDSFVRNHKLSEALCVVSCLHSCSSTKPPSISVYNQLLVALVEAKKDFKDVVYVYKEMVKAGIVPNTDTLNCLLQALLDAGRVEATLDHYRRMERKGCKPNSRTFEIIISGLISRDRFGESLVVLDEMFGSGCEPNLSFYASILPIFCEMNELEVGMRLFGMMRSSKISPSASMYGSMVQCLCKNLLADEALELLAEMIGSHLIPDESVFTSVIDVLCKTQRLGEARKLLEDYKVFTVSPYNLLLRAYFEAGKFRAARDLFDEMFKRDVTDVGSWNILIRHFCENEQMDDALKYLCKMVVLSVDPDADTFSALIIGKCLSDECEEALTLFHKVWDKSWVLDAVSYGKLIDCLCRGKRYEEAAEVFSLMSSKSLPLNSPSFGMLIKGICGNKVQILHGLSKRNNVDESSVYNTLINSLWRGGYRVEATKLLESVGFSSDSSGKGWIPNAYTHAVLMGSFVEDGKPTEESDACEDRVSSILAEGLADCD
ncbi:hypothetical protein DM860_007492 [Cuscuta australis]|uniref:Pentacotripeptide-repeat region of PRORP domain-containing protein n=1 Tax=Cuscuta australis TaxID=267555 RepID=A0A328E421_9ASTE|nr:hypothetical protein DM860_007492 [Cuscuta australis]